MGKTQKTQKEKKSYKSTYRNFITNNIHDIKDLNKIRENYYNKELIPLGYPAISILVIVVIANCSTFTVTILEMIYSP